jgi:methylthioribose-1-phosphate isomerase
VVAKASAKPATTIVKTGAPTARAASVKPAATSAAPVAAVSTTSTQFHDEGSTTLTTALAGALALLTWGTAAVLILSYLAVI